MDNITLHIPGAGNPLKPHNHKSRARLNVVLNMPANATAILYGCQQPDMAASEAELGIEYLHKCSNSAIERIELAQRISFNKHPKSTSETMQILCEYIEDSYKLNRRTPPHGFKAQEVVVNNWPYMPRTRYLLKKQWQRLYPNIPWEEARQHVRFLSVGDTFVPYWKQWGPLALLAWLVNPVGYEAGAWIKAFRDPYDKKLNQNRKWSQLLSKFLLKKN